MKNERPKLAITVAILLSIFFATYIIRDLRHGYLNGTTPTALEQYSSEDGVTFKYPNTYRLSSKNHEMAGAKWDSVELIPKNVVVPAFSDGPQSISLEVFDDSAGLSLEKYIKNDVRSNFTLSNGTLSPTTIGGQPAVTYQYSGLYEYDAVAVLHNNKVFVFSVGWSQTTDQIRRDYSGILSTITFQ